MFHDPRRGPQQSPFVLPGDQKADPRLSRAMHAWPPLWAQRLEQGREFLLEPPVVAPVVLEVERGNEALGSQIFPPRLERDLPIHVQLPLQLGPIAVLLFDALEHHRAQPGGPHLPEPLLGAQPAGRLVREVRRLDFLLLRVGRRQVQLGLGEAGFQADGGLVAGHRLRGVSRCQQGVPQVVMRPCPLRLDGNRLAVRRDSLLRASQSLTEIAKIEQGVSMRRLKAECLAKESERFIHFPGLMEDGTQVREGVGVPGADEQGTPIRLFGFPDPPQRAERCAEVVPEDGLRAIQRDGFLDVLDRLPKVALLVAGHAEKVQRPRVIRLPAEDLPVAVGRCARAARLMLAQGDPEGLFQSAHHP